MLRVRECSGPLPRADNATAPFFPALEYFNVSSNALTGPIPEEFARTSMFNASSRIYDIDGFFSLLFLLSDLGFDVSGNQLSGPLPAFLGASRVPPLLQPEIYLGGSRGRPLRASRTIWPSFGHQTCSNMCSVNLSGLLPGLHICPACFQARGPPAPAWHPCLHQPWVTSLFQLRHCGAEYLLRVSTDGLSSRALPGAGQGCPLSTQGSQPWRLQAVTSPRAG